MADSLETERLALQPDHVPDELVYDFDMYHDPEMIRNLPGRLVEVARQAPPIFWTPHNGGHWVVGRFSSVTRAARDWENFSSDHRKQAEAMMAALPPGTELLLPVPILLDPPEHTRFRAPLNAAFAPKAMMALKDKIRARAVSQIEKVRHHGRCEFVGAIGEPLPVQVFLELFGLPVDRRAEFRTAVREHFSTVPSGLHDSQQRLWKLVGVMEYTLIDRRDNPRGDLISLLWQSTVDGRPVSLGDMRNYCVLLFIAGLDTVMNAMAFGIRHLAEDQELQAELRADPGLIPEATEELLRRYGIVKSPRIAARDLTYEGVTMKAGERVFLYNPVANLDPDEFPEPEKIDLHRENKAHITFAAGPHRCLGSHLARIELQTLYEEMLSLLPTFRLDPGKRVSYRCNPVLGPTAVHLLWDA